MRSADGTTLAVTRSGTGPAVVLVGGGLDDGTENAPLASALSTRFTVYNYARRGRGNSGDTPPYSVAREIEDLAAIVASAVGAAHVYGVSSGGALALRAAAAGVPIDHLAVYEVPYPVDDAAVEGWQTYVTNLNNAASPDEALKLFMRLAGSTEDQITGAEASPMWPPLRKIAHTLAYDAACMGEGAPPVELLAKITQPTLVATGAVMDPHMGELQPGYFDTAADVVAESIPNAKRHILTGESHVADAAKSAAMLTDFFMS